MTIRVEKVASPVTALQTNSVKALKALSYTSVVGKICDLRQIARCMLKTVQDGCVVPVESVYETINALLNGDIA